MKKIFVEEPTQGCLHLGFHIRFDTLCKQLIITIFFFTKIFIFEVITQKEE